MEIGGNLWNTSAMTLLSFERTPNYFIFKNDCRAFFADAREVKGLQALARGK